jgi:hypothetical protein
MVRFYVRGTGYDLVPLCNFKLLKPTVTIFHSFFPQIRCFSVFGGGYRAAIPYIYINRCIARILPNFGFENKDLMTFLAKISQQKHTKVATAIDIIV